MFQKVSNGYEQYRLQMKAYVLVPFILFTSKVYSQSAESIEFEPPVKLNSPLVTSGNLLDSQISSDSQWVVYRADQDIDGVSEIYSIPIAGGEPTKLNPALVSGGNVLLSFKISPDSKRVVYAADQDTDNVVELYSVPITGGEAIKLNSDLVAGGGVSFFASDYQISPNSE